MKPLLPVLACLVVFEAGATPARAPAIQRTPLVSHI
jgi:hypothetical protein